MKKIDIDPLNEQEKYIIQEKGTEHPFTGQYRDTNTPWTYYCRQCGQALYYSADKFESDCWRPSFDDAIPGAVKQEDDLDGMRTEIICNHCEWHLGHVFTGEQLTDKNTRHCVNSASMIFVASDTTDKKSNQEQNYEVAILGWWCFRCIEAPLQRLKGVIQVQPWYSGGKREFPNYEQVTTWVSWHSEVVKVIFDTHIINYETLLKVFFTLHDPTSKDKQWNDEGSQYRSIIFTTHDDQRDISVKIIKQLENNNTYESPIVTEVRPLEKFRPAEWYHHNFYNQHPEKPYCKMIITPKIEKLKEERKDLMQ